MITPDIEIWLVFAILAGAVLLFVTGWVRPDVTASLALFALAATGLLTPEEALSGFSSDAVIATAGLLVLSAGLVRSGVVRRLAEFLDAPGESNGNRLALLVTAAPGLLSGLVSAVATVSLFIPVVLRLARKNKVPRARLLLPIAMAAMAGGNLTLIGAAHNLVVNSLLRRAGQPTFAFFELAPVGLALLALVCVYTLVLGPRLLPGQQEDEAAGDLPQGSSYLIQTYDLADRLWEVWVKRGSDVIGKTILDLDLGRDYGLNVLSVVHNMEPRLKQAAELKLKAGDILLLSGRRARVEELVQARDGLLLMGHPRPQEEYPSSKAEFIEVVVPPRSPVVGKTLVELDFRNEAGLIGVGVWRKDKPLRTDVGVLPLQEGDALLLYGSRDQVRSYEPEPNFVWLHPPRREEAPRELRRLGPAASVVMAMVILSAALEWLPISVAALGGAAAMILLGILTPGQAYERVDWRTVVLIGAMIPLGLAMERTGAAELLSGLLVGSLGQAGPLAAMVGVCLLAMLLTQSLHGAAVAVIMTPVALQAAALLGAAPKPFAVAVIVGAAVSYLLPVGHPAPLLVQSPGGYVVKDYLKFGAGLFVLTLLLVGVLVPLIWPF